MQLKQTGLAVGRTQASCAGVGGPSVLTSSAAGAAPSVDRTALDAEHALVTFNSTAQGRYVLRTDGVPAQSVQVVPGARAVWQLVPGPLRPARGCSKSVALKKIDRLSHMTVKVRPQSWPTAAAATAGRAATPCHTRHLLAGLASAAGTRLVLCNATAAVQYRKGTFWTTAGQPLGAEVHLAGAPAGCWQHRLLPPQQPSVHRLRRTQTAGCRKPALPRADLHTQVTSAQQRPE